MPPLFGGTYKKGEREGLGGERMELSIYPRGVSGGGRACGERALQGADDWRAYASGRPHGFAPLRLPRGTTIEENEETRPFLLVFSFRGHDSASAVIDPRIAGIVHNSIVAGRKIAGMENSLPTFFPPPLLRQMYEL